MNVIALSDEELEQLAGGGRAQNGRIVLLLEDARLVANDDAVAVHLLLHVRVVAGPVDAQQQTAVGQPVHFHVLGRPVQRQKVTVRTRFRRLS